MFDTFYAPLPPLTTNFTRQEPAMRAAGCALLARTGPSSLISHSVSGGFAVAIVDNCLELVLANILLEPACIPFAGYF